MAFKYNDPKWGEILGQELKNQNMSQVEMAKRMGKTSGTVRMLLRRNNYLLANVRAISQALGKDYVELLLSEESQALLAKARSAGFHPGQEFIQDGIDTAVAKVAKEKEVTESSKKALEEEAKALRVQLADAQSREEELKAKLHAKEDQVKSLETDLGKSGEELKAAHKAIEQERTKFAEAQKEYTSQLASWEKNIQELKDEKREMEYNSKLKIAVLEAKLEVLQPGEKG